MVAALKIKAKITNKIKAKIKYYLELLNLKIFTFIGQTELKSVFNRNLNLQVKDKNNKNTSDDGCGLRPTG